jgi:ERF superfamily
MATQDYPMKGFPAEQPEQTTAPNLTLRFEFSPQGIGSLFRALAKAQKAFKAVKKTSVNPFFKSNYADLAEVIDATRDGLADNGIAVIQPPCYRRPEGTAEIHTFMAHSSGEWIHTILDMPVSKTDAQGVGAAITYGRRYAYSGTVCVASEPDDDGNAASGKKVVKEETNEEFDQRTEGQQCLAVFQISAIDEACKRSGKTEEEVAAFLSLIGHKRIEHVLKSQFQEFLKWANTKVTPKPTKGPTAAEQGRMAANKKLWALAAEHSIPEGDVKACAYERYKVQSMNELTTPQLVDMAKWVSEVASAVQES